MQQSPSSAMAAMAGTDEDASIPLPIARTWLILFSKIRAHSNIIISLFR